jgi:hypothetical protein
MFWHVVKVIKNMIKRMKFHLRTLMKKNENMSDNETKNMLEDSLRNPYHNAYLTDLSFNEIGKLYLKDSIIPMDNNVTFALLDTISYCKKKDIDFFLNVFEKIMIKSDGALAEAVGQYTLKFINNRPEIFVNHIDTINYTIIDKWANYTAYEMYFKYSADSLVYYCNQLSDKLKGYGKNKSLIRFEDRINKSAKALIEE